MQWEVIRYSDFPAFESLLRFENAGTADTPILEQIQSLDLTFDRPLNKQVPYRLHRTNGAPSNPTDFQVDKIDVDDARSVQMGGGGGTVPHA